jgi:hypothetical protein
MEPEGSSSYSQKHPLIARWIRSTFKHISFLRSNLILSSHQRVGFAHRSFSSKFFRPQIYMDFSLLPLMLHGQRLPVRFIIETHGIAWKVAWLDTNNVCFSLCDLCKEQVNNNRSFGRYIEHRLASPKSRENHCSRIYECVMVHLLDCWLACCWPETLSLQSSWNVNMEIAVCIQLT